MKYLSPLLLAYEDRMNEKDALLQTTEVKCVRYCIHLCMWVYTYCHTKSSVISSSVTQSVGCALAQCIYDVMTNREKPFCIA